LRTVGIVGGIGPESTVDYYRRLLASFRERGAIPDGLLINSINVAHLLALMRANDPGALVLYLLRALEPLARGGAELALFAANTPHAVFDEVQQRTPLKLVSIVRATCESAYTRRLRRVGLLGTRFTMQGRFYPDVFEARGIAVMTPQGSDLEYVHDRYVNELVAGTFRDDTRAGLLAVIERMRQRDGIDGVVLGGTELPLILRGVTEVVPFLDTTAIHVEAVVDLVLS
jgi:aspartate racemase